MKGPNAWKVRLRMHQSPDIENPATTGIVHDKQERDDEQSPVLQRASQLQERAELWQNVAIREQDVASLLQRAAVHQHELIGLLEASEDETVKSRFRQLEEELLKLVSSAFAAEGLALGQVERAIKKTEEALYAEEL